MAKQKQKWQVSFLVTEVVEDGEKPLKKKDVLRAVKMVYFADGAKIGKVTVEPVS